MTQNLMFIFLNLLYARKAVNIVLGNNNILKVRLGALYISEPLPADERNTS